MPQPVRGRARPHLWMANSSASAATVFSPPLSCSMSLRVVGSGGGSLVGAATQRAGVERLQSLGQMAHGIGAWGGGKGGIEFTAVRPT